MYGKCKMSVPNSNFQRNFSTYVFGKCFWHFREVINDCWTSRHLLWEKKFKLYRKSRWYKNCRKEKYMWISHFPEVFSTNMVIGNDFFVFKYPVKCKKKFQIFIIFIEIYVWLLYANPLMTSIIFHTRRLNTQEYFS